jgi:spore germination protein KB
MIGPVILAVTVITFILSIKNIEWEHIFPIYADSGLISILNGSLSPISFLGESVIILMLTSFTQDPKKGVSFAILGVGVISLLITLLTMEVILVFGPGLSSRMWYPYFQMVGFISIMEFVQNIEIVVTIIWILSIFIKLSTFLFVSSYSIAELFHLKDWRKVIWFIAIIIIPLSMFYPNIVSASVTYPQKFWIPFIVPINMAGIPLLLLIIGTIRKKRNENQNKHTNLNKA